MKNEKEELSRSELERLWEQTLAEFQRRFALFLSQEKNGAELSFFTECETQLQNIQQRLATVSSEQRERTQLLDKFLSVVQHTSRKLTSTMDGISHGFVTPEDIVELTDQLSATATALSHCDLEQFVPSLLVEMNEKLLRIDALEKQLQQLEEQRNTSSKISWKSVQENIQLSNELGECCCALLELWTTAVQDNAVSETAEGSPRSIEKPVLPASDVRTAQEKNIASTTEKHDNLFDEGSENLQEAEELYRFPDSLLKWDDFCDSYWIFFEKLLLLARKV